MSGRNRANSDSSSHATPPLSGVEVKADSVCICFIDDCLDCDVPLAELTFSRENDWMKWCSDVKHRYCNRIDMYGLSFIAGLSVLQRIGSMQEGKASFTLSGDYYNRELSGEVITVGPGPPVGTLCIVKKSLSVCKSIRSLVWSHSIGRYTSHRSSSELGVNQRLSVYISKHAHT